MALRTSAVASTPPTVQPKSQTDCRSFMTMVPRCRPAKPTAAGAKGSAGSRLYLPGAARSFGMIGAVLERLRLSPICQARQRGRMGFAAAKPILRNSYHNSAPDFAALNPGYAFCMFSFLFDRQPVRAYVYSHAF